jgi:hypothetical protein
MHSATRPYFFDLRLAPQWEKLVQDQQLAV